MSGGGLSFNAWVIKRKGPVVVSLFSPIATVVCVVVSAFTMEESFNLGRYIYFNFPFFRVRSFRQNEKSLIFSFFCVKLALRGWR